MVDPNIYWIYLLVFLVIPLSRIIPRLLAKRRAHQGKEYPPSQSDMQQPSSDHDFSEGRGSSTTSTPPSSSPPPVSHPSDYDPTPTPSPPPPPPSSSSKPNPKQQPPSHPKPPTTKILVLGVIHRGSNTFENIQKNTGLDSDTLDEILKHLENNDLIYVHQKQGLFGSKIEIHPTEKGFKEYYS